MESCKKSWVEVMFKNKTYNLANIDGLYIQNIATTHPVGENDQIEIKGVDGVIPAPSTYKPFELEIELMYRGVDAKDVELLVFRLNNFLSVRDSYYIRHSNMPGLKYAVLPNPKIEDEYKTLRDRTIKITFTCYKGYSESYEATNKMNFINDDWQFQEGLKAADKLKYVHYDWGYEIYNGSSDYINPFNQSLTIKLNLDAPKGFTLHNKTTGDKFEYYEPLKRNETFELRDVYPIKNYSEHVGHLTNFEWITLAPGYNDIEIYGRDLGYTKSEWIFNFTFK